MPDAQKPGSSPPATDPVDERALVALLDAARKLFGREVSPTDNFFDLGGKSLGAIRLVALVKAAGFRLKINDVLDEPDLRAVAGRAVERARPRT